MTQDDTSLARRAQQRAQLRAARAALSARDRVEAATAVAGHLAAHPVLQRPGHVAGYWAMGGELPLHAVMARLSVRHTYCLPRLHPDGHLVFAPWAFGDPVAPNRFGIPEPQVGLEACLPAHALQAALVPLLGFDRRGNRLGTGGGWYDRSFAFRRGTQPPPWLIGVGFALQELDAIRAEAWDVVLDAVVTENELIAPAADD